MKIQFHGRGLTRALLLVAIALLLGHTAVKFAEFGLGHARLLGLNRLLDLNQESNFGAWFAWSMLMGTSMLLVLAGALEHAANRTRAHGWWFLAAIFAFLSLDEAASLHERLDALREPLNATGFLFFPWILAGVTFAAVVALASGRLLLSVSPAVRGRMIGGGLLFVFGAVGFEMVQAAVWEAASQETGMVATLVGIEEFLEMLGVIIFISAVLRHLRGDKPSIELHITAPGPAPAPAPTPAPTPTAG